MLPCAPVYAAMAPEAADDIGHERYQRQGRGMLPRFERRAVTHWTCLPVGWLGAVWWCSPPTNRNQQRPSQACGSTLVMRRPRTRRSMRIEGGRENPCRREIVFVARNHALRNYAISRCVPAACDEHCGGGVPNQ